MPDSTSHLRLDHCSINTATLGHRLPFAQALELIAQAGFGYVAPWRRDLEGRDLAQARRQLRDCGLKVNAYCRSTYLPATTRQGFEAALEDNRRAIEEAAELQAECFIMVVGGLSEGSRDLPAARAQVTEGIGLLLEHARRHRVALALEPLHPMYAADRSCLSTLEQALDLCETLEPDGFDALGVAIDAYHCWWDPALDRQVHRAGQQRRILGLHLSDWLVPTRDLLLDRGMMGDGVIDLRSLRQSVQAAGYRGATEVEIFSRDDWWQREPDEVLRTCARRLQQHC
ncbi:sugar phosphate isomerase/epimerase [Pseudomonas sp. GD03860]|uniref:sugar phosphate isomerase/epimerase family protein n=1 Tax=Pseudomonas TaxID=286 RepID=UPI002364803B|nr:MULTISPECIES: sugar phosphate isomerase/epimerase family protein [Pseudomonas]MDD2058309.1 sugar phosphate isomerase/epimerase [Pseudomonas putida]MDH0636242.1 sugar phosphate isomerase/epimerase [Pseudomonas sp. GD03860]